MFVYYILLINNYISYIVCNVYLIFNFLLLWVIVYIIDYIIYICCFVKLILFSILYNIKLCILLLKYYVYILVYDMNWNY